MAKVGATSIVEDREMMNAIRNGGAILRARFLYDEEPYFPELRILADPLIISIPGPMSCTRAW